MYPTQASFTDTPTSLQVSTKSVAEHFKRMKVNQAKGPDEICGDTLRYCAAELSDVFHELLWLFLYSGVVADLWKNSNIIPVTKTSRQKII